jgi:glycosyltransferase involved in cell wall biosynthesis
MDILRKSEKGKGADVLIARADKSRDEGDWQAAAQLYREALNINGRLAHIWVQYGHALKESGKRAEAEEAYRIALSIDNQADTFIQLGHLLKISGRKAEALESYKKALQITPNDPSIKKEIHACQAGLGEKLARSAGTHKIYFEISDLIFYIGHHDNLTGIQRVQASIILALLDLDLGDATIHFLTYVNSRAAFYEIDPNFVISLLYDLSLNPAARQVDFDKPAACDGYIRTAEPLKAPSAETKNILCLLGAGWVNRDYFLRLRNLKRNNGFYFTSLLHDLIPIFARETCDQGTAEVFTNFLSQSSQYADGYFCVSESTRNDLLRYAAKMGWQIPDPIVTRNGSLLPSETQQLSVQTIDADLVGRNYVLFVSTIEGRKNHLSVFQAFEKLLRERGDAPYLVCVGRLGWRAEDFLFACEASNFLNGKIKILSDISDNELTALYRNCLLTLYPSLYEGWGLPVGESLSFGKVCITSNVTSLPEVGGDFATYVDPLKPDEIAQAIALYLDDPEALAKAEDRIRSQHRPTSWADVASKIIAGCISVAHKPAKTPLVAIETGHEYPIHETPRLAANLMGERMLEAISSSRRRSWLPGIYSNADYMLGQGLRLGEGWCAPEPNFTWARINGAAIGFSLSGPVSEPLSVFLAYVVTEPCIGAELIFESSHQTLLSCKIERAKSHIVLHGLKPTIIAGEPQYFMRLKIKGVQDLEEKLTELDRRAPAIGVTCLIVVQESDLASRLTILERLSFK